MVSLRVLVAMSGRDRAWSVGDRYECDETAAQRLVAAGMAEYVDVPAAPDVVETAMAAGAPERAMRPRGKARR